MLKMNITPDTGQSHPNLAHFLAEFTISPFPPPNSSSVSHHALPNDLDQGVKILATVTPWPYLAHQMVSQLQFSLSAWLPIFAWVLQLCWLVYGWERQWVEKVQA